MEKRIYHLCQTPSRYYVSCVHESVQMACALLDLFPHVVVDLHVENVCDEVEGILVILYFCVQASQVESVREIVFVNFAEVFVATCRNELEETSVSFLRSANK